MSRAQSLQTADQVSARESIEGQTASARGARSVIGTLPAEVRLSTCRGKCRRGNTARPVTMLSPAAEPPSRGYSRDGARDKSW